MPTIIFNNNAVLDCSTIKAEVFDVTVKKYGKEYYFAEASCTVEWYDSICDWIKINDIYYDSKDIQPELLIQIYEFMLDPRNYKVINMCDH